MGIGDGACTAKPEQGRARVTLGRVPSSVEPHADQARDAASYGDVVCAHASCTFGVPIPCCPASTKPLRRAEQALHVQIRTPSIARGPAATEAASRKPLTFKVQWLQVAGTYPSTPQHAALRRPLWRAAGATSAARLAAAALARRDWAAAALAVLSAVRAPPLLRPGGRV